MIFTVVQIELENNLGRRGREGNTFEKWTKFSESLEHLIASLVALLP